MRLMVNGRRHELDTPPHSSLLDLLRDQLGLTGTKECCDVGECGACTVLLDGRSVNSCLVLGIEVDDSSVITIEGLAIDGRLNALQDAFLTKGAVQCGFCIPGQIMAAHYLLQCDPHPTLETVQEALSGNLCRCGGYAQICDAVLEAAAESPSLRSPLGEGKIEQQSAEKRDDR
jgi:aerobic carbon-monoxide dehydrogenase small subunit